MRDCATLHHVALRCSDKQKPTNTNQHSETQEKQHNSEDTLKTRKNANTCKTQLTTIKPVWQAGNPGRTRPGSEERWGNLNKFGAWWQRRTGKKKGRGVLLLSKHIDYFGVAFSLWWSVFSDATTALQESTRNTQDARKSNTIARKQHRTHLGSMAAIRIIKVVNGCLKKKI